LLMVLKVLNEVNTRDSQHECGLEILLKISHIPPKNVQRHSEGDQIWQDSYAVGLKMIGENELS